MPPAELRLYAIKAMQRDAAALADHRAQAGAKRLTDWDQDAAIEALSTLPPRSLIFQEFLEKVAVDPTSGPVYRLTFQGRATLERLRSAFFPVMGDDMRSFIEGMSVSIDVSTCEDNACHRYFGTVTEVMDDPEDKHGVTLLVQDAVPNFQSRQQGMEQALVKRESEAWVALAKAGERFSGPDGTSLCAAIDRLVAAIEGRDVGRPTSPADSAVASGVWLVTDDMAMAFHRALSDGSIGQSDVDEIKFGLRAALAAAPQPGQEGS